MVRLKVALLALGALVIQASVLSSLRPAGIRSDVLLLLPIAAGIVAGPQRGAVIGFGAGLVADLFLLTPFGLSALAYTLVGFGVGVMQSNVIRATWWISPLTAAAASAVGVVVYALVGATVGQSQLVRPELGVIALSVAVVNGLLAIAAVPAVRWALADAGERGYIARRSFT
jgi:rod shape-determining protein MreD